MRAVDEIVGRQKFEARLAGPGKIRGDRAHDVALPRADPVRISRDFPQTFVGGEETKCAREQARIARSRPVERPVEGRGEVEAAVGIDVVCVDQLDQTQGREFAQLLQVRLLERLDDDRGVPMVPPGRGEDGHQALLDRQSDGLVISRMLDLGVDSDRAVLFLGLALGELDDLLQRRDLELAVELLRALGEVLHCAQPLDFGEREVGGEETFVRCAVDHRRAPARGKLGPTRHVGRVDYVRLVARDEMAVLRGHQVRLDEIGPELDREGVALQRVRRQVAVRAAMADHQGPREFIPLAVAIRMDGQGKQGADRGREQAACDDGSKVFHRPLLSSPEVNQEREHSSPLELRRDDVDMTST